MLKRGQVFDQMVTYIMVAVIVLSLIIFGYKGFMSMQERHYQTSVLDFQSQLTAAVDKVTTKRGTVETIRLAVPSRVEQICISDVSTSYLLEPPWEETIVRELVDSEDTVFLITSSDAVPIAFQTKPLKTDKDFKCFTANSNFITFRLEGFGTYSTIRPV